MSSDAYHTTIPCALLKPFFERPVFPVAWRVPRRRWYGSAGEGSRPPVLTSRMPHPSPVPVTTRPMRWYVRQPRDLFLRRTGLAALIVLGIAV